MLRRGRRRKKKGWRSYAIRGQRTDDRGQIAPPLSSVLCPLSSIACVQRDVVALAHGGGMVMA